MPDKPLWYTRLEDVIQQLEALPSPWVDRAALEIVLGVGRRRAQQILQPLVRHTIGRNGLADRVELIGHLRHLAAGETVHYENRRRERLAAIMNELQDRARRQPRVLVEAPIQVVNQEMDKLPRGVRVESGRIVIEFEAPQQALEKLLALAMAIGNDYGMFERLAGR